MRPRRLPVLLLLLLVAVAVGLVLAGLVPLPLPDGDRGASRTIVLFTIDTLRRDHVGAYAPREAAVAHGRMPRLSALAEGGLRFEDARSPVPLTLPAHTTMLTGLPPAVTGVRLNTYGRIPPPEGRGFPLLAEAFRDGGWRTGAFVSASPLKASYGLDQGFEHYDDEGLQDETGFTYEERPGPETVDRALAWLQGQDREAPVFLFVHVFEPHYPYARDLDRVLPPDAAYAHDCELADAALGRFLDGLARLGRGDAIVCVAADHGEALDELGERTHGLLLGDAVLRVPLVLAGGGLAAAVRQDPADLADVAPTLAALAGLPAWPRPGGPGTGRDLLAGPAPADRIRVAESLYAHHLHGWAQLAAAVDPAGPTLVDAGMDRLLWLEPAPFGEPQAGPRDAAGRPGVGRLGDALRAYRQGERPERISSGGVAAGYGHAARVAPFLSPAENGRLPDPYAVITRHFALDVEKQRLLAVPPQVVARRLEAMAAEDPGDPAVRFWIGRAWQRRAETAPDADDAADARQRAATAYLEAWERGRRDATTLLLAIGVLAEDDATGALARLERLEGEVPPDCQLLLLKARLLRDAGRDADADAACREADRACRSPRERALFERAQAAETCR